MSLERGPLEGVRTRLDDFVLGSVPLSGLDLYYELEQVTPLREFHTMLRSGPQNRLGSGLQQSYGDHNRLLLLGIDKLCAGDLAWYHDRLDPPRSVGDDRLQACFARVRSLELGHAAMVALWLAAAFHDYGLLGAHGPGIEVEDGVALAADVIDELCPEGLRTFTSFETKTTVRPSLRSL